MAKKPPDRAWTGFTPEQSRLLDRIDTYGNNGWDRNGQSEELMPILLTKAAELDLTLEQIKTAMASIDYDAEDLHQLDRWESKRTAGRFGR